MNMGGQYISYLYRIVYIYNDWSLFRQVFYDFCPSLEMRHVILLSKMVYIHVIDSLHTAGILDVHLRFKTLLSLKVWSYITDNKQHWNDLNEMSLKRFNNKKLYMFHPPFLCRHFAYFANNWSFFKQNDRRNVR